MIRIAIVDDNKQSIEKVMGLTRAFLQGKGETARIRTYEAPMELLLDLDHGMYYDLFLLDVEMSVMTGIETAREIRKYYTESSIIFITDYVEYSIQAFEVNAFRYIPKIELDTKLPAAFEAIWPVLLEQQRKCYIIQYYLDIEVLQFRDIFYLRKEGKYVVICHTEGESRVRRTLKSVLAELDAEEFFEIARGYAVNIRHIRSLVKREVYLQNGMAVPVGKYDAEKVRERIVDYWAGRN